MHYSSSKSLSSSSSSFALPLSGLQKKENASSRRRHRTPTRAIFGLFETTTTKTNDDDDALKKKTSNDDDSSTETKGSPPSPQISQTLQSLDDLLGEDPKIIEERKADERAQASYALQQEKKERKEETKKMYKKRFEKFQFAVKQSTSIQRLQAVFLEGFLLPNVASSSSSSREEKMEFFELPSEIIDPRTGDRLKASAKASSSSSGSTGEEDATTTTITNSTVNRLPGEFQIPIIPYGHVVVPGARAKLNLFEPRWLTLFSKLLKPEDAEEDRTILTSHEWGGSRDAKTIDFSKVEMIADYESGERRFDIVPGANRYPEDGFVGTNAFGAVYRGIDGKIAGLGVKMEIEAHDVAVDGILLSVCARASANRFKILRVVQTEPYIIVDAVPYDDDFANASMDEDVSEAEQNLLDALETLKSNDNYYYEAVGLQYDEDPSTGKISVKKLIEPEFKSFTFSEIFLYNKDDVALQILASKSPKERAEIVTNIAKQMKAGMKFGLNPRNARVLRILTFWGSLFAIGSGLTLVRDIAGF